jgi:probable H4MPT-linked C1 transfer pathway protein
MELLGIDIGGANLKAASQAGWCVHQHFPLWRQPDGLVQVIRQLIDAAPQCSRIAATMTGELADCFRSKAEGVRWIVDALVEAAGEREVRIYHTDGMLAPPKLTRERPELAAASNWHALARYVGTLYARGPVLLADLGSTTCDLIPLIDGRLAARGSTDLERLRSGELVYTGASRTPLCSLVTQLPYGDELLPIARENFATTLDAYLMLGRLPESAADTSTADGRPATHEFARDRLARMLCLDRDAYTMHDAMRAAWHIESAQVQEIAGAMNRAVEAMPSPRLMVISGEGEFLLQKAISSAAGRYAWAELETVSLAAKMGSELSRCAPAYAVAQLAESDW